MSNIILDPTKWNPSVYTYKGPVDQDKKGKPRLRDPPPKHKKK